MGEWGITPRILNLGTRWEEKSTSQPAQYPPEETLPAVTKEDTWGPELI